MKSDMKNIDDLAYGTIVVKREGEWWNRTWSARLEEWHGETIAEARQLGHVGIEYRVLREHPQRGVWQEVFIPIRYMKHTTMMAGVFLGLVLGAKDWEEALKFKDEAYRVKAVWFEPPKVEDVEGLD